MRSWLTLDRRHGGCSPPPGSCRLRPSGLRDLFENVWRKFLAVGYLPQGVWRRLSASGDLPEASAGTLSSNGDYREAEARPPLVRGDLSTGWWPVYSAAGDFHGGGEQAANHSRDLAGARMEVSEAAGGFRGAQI